MLTLERYLVLSGCGNRRHCAWLVRQGRVRINDKIAKDSKKKVSSGSSITLDGNALTPAQLTSYLLHKPVGYVCQTGEMDPSALNLLPDVHGLTLVGRLDRDSEGLIIATNDGNLSHHLTHPDHHLPKIYRVTVKGLISKDTFQTLCSGLPVDGRPTRPLEGKILDSQHNHSTLELTLTEGRKRQIRVLCDSVGHPVEQLTRIQIGHLKMGGLKPGDYRLLTDEDLAPFNRSE